MHNKLQITMQKSLNDFRLSVKPSYASMASPLRAPDDLNVNYSLQLANNVECPINEQVNIQITPDKSNGTNVVDTDFVKHSLQLADVNIQALTSFKADRTMNDTYKEQSNYVIHVRIQGHTQEIEPVNNDVFVVYFRRNDRIYFMTDWFLVFNATFRNISAISWRPVLVVEEAGVPGENHRPWARVRFITCGCESSAPFLWFTKPGVNPRRIGDRLAWVVR